MEDRLLSKMFEYDRWVELLDKADEKGINKTVLRKMSSPQVRLELYNRIKNGQYEIMPPHIGFVPKDNGEKRTVYINEAEDRVICTLINDCIAELFKDYISPACVSYQKGIGSQETVQRVSDEVHKLQSIKGRQLGYKSDFTKFFDTLSLEAIDMVFDKIEKGLGFDKGTEPVVNVLRKYYHSTMYFDEHKVLQNKFLSLRQGCACAAVLSNMALFELDEYMRKKYKVYYRYSDDICCLDEDTSEVIDDINRICAKYDVKLNPKKVQPLYKDEWFTFLGFKLKDDMITLSKNRTKDITKEIFNATVRKPKVNKRQALINIKRILYGNGDGYSWSSACFGAMRKNEKDIETLNNFIMDCIRLCEIRDKKYEERKRKGLKVRYYDYKWDNIGGIGSVNNLSDYTMIRGSGSCVGTAKERTQKEIDHYKSVGCLLKCYKLGKPIYEATVRGI